VTALEWLSFSLGQVIVVGPSVSVIKTLVVPRRAWSFLPRVVDSAVTRVFMTVARRMRSYDLIDRFLGFLGPIALILTLLMWLGMFVVGLALMLHPPADDFAAAIGHSGAATFTLGINTTTAGSSTAISVAANATGLIVIALMVAYLPALCAVIRRREALGRQLGAHSESPPWGSHVPQVPGSEPVPPAEREVPLAAEPPRDARRGRTRPELETFRPVGRGPTAPPVRHHVHQRPGRINAQDGYSRFGCRRHKHRVRLRRLAPYRRWLPD